MEVRGNLRPVAGILFYSKLMYSITIRLGIYGDTHFWVTRMSYTMGMIDLSGLKSGYLKVKSDEMVW